MNSIIFSTLKKIFSALDKSEIESLYNESIQVQCPAKTYITGPNDDDYSLYICLFGIIKVNYESINGEELSITYLKKGEIFGELSAIDGQQRSASCIAKTDCTLLKIPSSVVRNLLDNNKNFNRAILTVLINRIRETDAKLFSVGRHSSAQIIAEEVIKLANLEGEDDDRGEVPFIPKHQELALLAIVSREQTTRTMNKFKKEGLIIKEDGRLVIPSIQKLQDFIDR